MSAPLVSICCITYNQKAYIEQTVLSFLSQKTDFGFEILINDDNSTDGTSQLCEKIVNENPSANIRYQRNPKNLGVTGNWVDSIKRASGKYIAICEGDDFWTDANKLQKQVDFLEANPAYVGCFHNTEERFEEDDSRASFLYNNFTTAQKITFEDLTHVNSIPTCSVLFRSGLFQEFPEWYFKLKMADWSLHLLNAEHGDFWYIPKIMGVHRLHTQSTWALQDIKKNGDFIIEAYNVMTLHGFKTNETSRSLLVKAKDEFVRKLSPQKPSVKERVKGKLVHIINKL